MTITVDFDSIISNLVEAYQNQVYFILITTTNGVVVKSYINEDEFNKAAIGLNISQLYELAEEIAEDIGLQSPDFNIVHSDNYYILSIKILEHIIILLTQDQIRVKDVFEIINEQMTGQ